MPEMEVLDRALSSYPSAPLKLRLVDLETKEGAAHEGQRSTLTLTIPVCVHVTPFLNTDQLLFSQESVLIPLL